MEGSRASFGAWALALRMLGVGSAWPEIKAALQKHAGMAEVTTARFAERLMPRRDPSLLPKEPEAASDQGPDKERPAPIDPEALKAALAAQLGSEVKATVRENLAAIEARIEEAKIAAENKAREIALKAKEESDTELQRIAQEVNRLKVEREAQHVEEEPEPWWRAHRWALAAAGALVVALGLWRVGTVQAANHLGVFHLGIQDVDGVPQHVSIWQDEMGDGKRYSTARNPGETDEQWLARHIADVELDYAPLSPKN